MIYGALSRRLPGFLRDRVLHFECEIDRAVAGFAASLPPGARVLDAGAGECRHAPAFTEQRYIAVDLGVGEPAWNYKKLDCIADLAALPLASGSCDACVNIVTLEHVPEPAKVVSELARALRPGGRLLLVVPLEWEVHQAPHDYFRYTRHGVEYLLSRSGFTGIRIEPVGGFFRLLARRLFNGLQFFPGPLLFLAALFLAPPALVAPLLDPLDRRRDFTLGYICAAQKGAL
jgi:SAM-dependent methyltransferase